MKKIFKQVYLLTKSPKKSLPFCGKGCDRGVFNQIIEYFDKVLFFKMGAFQTVSFLFLLLFFASCDVSKNKPIPENQFTIIFENNDSGNDYYPIDIKQTADKGYLILAEIQNTKSDFPIVYLIKTDEKGKVLWEKMSDTYVSPASQLIESGGDILLVCMNKNTNNAALLKADENLSIVADVSGIIYPIAAQKTSDGIAILSYFPDDKQTIFSKINFSGNVSLTSKYDVYEDLQERIFLHITRRGKKLPFFTGENSVGSYYFNGLNNFTHSLVFVNQADPLLSKVITGVRYESAISSLLPLSNGNFATTIYDIAGNTRLLTQEKFATQGSVKDLGGTALSELVSFSQVNLKKANLNGKNTFLLNASTKNGQAIVSCYDESSGAFINSNYFGSGSKTEVGNIATTADGGLAILVKNFVAGRYGRIMLYKLTKEQADVLGGKVVK